MIKKIVFASLLTLAIHFANAQKITQKIEILTTIKGTVISPIYII